MQLFGIKIFSIADPDCLYVRARNSACAYVLTLRIWLSTRKCNLWLITNLLGRSKYFLRKSRSVRDLLRKYFERPKRLVINYKLRFLVDNQILRVSTYAHALVCVHTDSQDLVIN